MATTKKKSIRRRKGRKRPISRPGGGTRSRRQEGVDCRRYSQQVKNRSRKGQGNRAATTFASSPSASS
jgi:hypothetical protein